MKPWADSPTIKSYTRWDRLWSVVSEDGMVEIQGLKPKKGKAEPMNELEIEHLRRAPHYEVTGQKVVLRALKGSGHVHITVELNGTLVVEEKSLDAPLFTTAEVKGRGRLIHILEGSHPHYSRWSLKGDIEVLTLIKGMDAHLSYRGGGSLSLKGVSLPGRSDVHHVLEAGRVVNHHLLLPDTSSFLVHRAKVMVKSGGFADVQTVYLPGGFVVAVPSVEVYGGNVESATHGVKTLSLSPEAAFYLRSRGLAEKEALPFLVEEHLKSMWGDSFPLIREKLTSSLWQGLHHRQRGDT